MSAFPLINKLSISFHHYVKSCARKHALAPWTIHARARARTYTRAERRPLKHRARHTVKQPVSNASLYPRAHTRAHARSHAHARNSATSSPTANAPLQRMHHPRLLHLTNLTSLQTHSDINAQDHQRNKSLTTS